MRLQFEATLGNVLITRRMFKKCLVGVNRSSVSWVTTAGLGLVPGLGEWHPQEGVCRSFLQHLCVTQHSCRLRCHLPASELLHFRLWLKTSGETWPLSSVSLASTQLPILLAIILLAYYLSKIMSAHLDIQLSHGPVSISEIAGSQSSLFLMIFHVASYFSLPRTSFFIDLPRKCLVLQDPLQSGEPSWFRSGCCRGLSSGSIALCL